MVAVPVKEHVAVHLDMRQRRRIVGPGPAIARVGYQQVRPGGILPPELPETVVGRHLEFVVDDEEVIGAEGLCQGVRLAAQLPDVVGVGVNRAKSASCAVPCSVSGVVV